MLRMRVRSGAARLFLLAALGVVLQACGSITSSDPALLAPTELVAIPVTDGVTLSWSGNGGAEEGFEVERNSGTAPFLVVATLPSDTTSYTDHPPGTEGSYVYRVRAVSGTVRSSPSEEATYTVALVDSSSSEMLSIASAGTSVTIPPGLFRQNSTLGVTVSQARAEGLGYGQIGPTVRLLLESDHIDLESGSPLEIHTPPATGYTSKPTSATIAWVELGIASGEPIGFFTNYNLGEYPTLIDMEEIRQVALSSQLGKQITLEIEPVDMSLTREDLGWRKVPEIDYDEGLFRLDIPDPVGTYNPGSQCLEGSEVSDFASARAAFGATPAISSQAAWTSALNKKPLILIIGWQAIPFSSVVYRYSEFFRKGPGSATTYFAPHLCGWTEFISEFAADQDLRDNFTLYVFGYDSVRERVSSNGGKLRDALASAFGSEPSYVVAHSMGGMVTKQAMQLGADVAQLYSLGTPYRGSGTVGCLLPGDHPDRGGESYCDQAQYRVRPYGEFGTAFTQAQLIALAFPGTKDLAYEDMSVLPDPGWVWTPDYVNNPYLERLNSEVVDGERFTAFFGNVLKSDGKIDKRDEDEYPNRQGFMGNAVHGQLAGRFNDGVVTAESAALLELLEDHGINYSDLGTLAEHSPFDNVVLVPCMSHTELAKVGTLLGTPSGTDCSSATLTEVETIYGYISRDLTRRVAGAGASKTVSGTISPIPSGDWRVVAYDLIDNEVVGPSAVVEVDGSFTLRISEAHHSGPARSVNLGTDVTVQPAVSRFRQSTLLAFDDSNGDGLITAGERMHLVNDHANTFADDAFKYIQLWLADRPFGITGTSFTTTGSLVSWAVTLDAGWGRWMYESELSQAYVTVRGDAVTTGLRLALGTQLNATSGEALNLHNLIDVLKGADR